MKNLLLIIFSMLTFSSLISLSQNLVPNSSFEIYSSCPTGQGQISLATGWGNLGGTPDYFNSCAINPDFSVPDNWGGYQQAYLGNAYAGIGIISSLQSEFSEYVGIQLTSGLNIGEKYFVSLHVSLGLDSSHGWTGASNNLGVLFSTMQYSTSTPLAIKNYAQINSSVVITDTVNWATISGSFIADSAYKYIIIGRFFADSVTTFTPIQEFVFEDAAYYFVDNVCVSTDSLTCNGINSINEELLLSEINIFPNPVKDQIIIENIYDKNFSIQILNIIGQNVLEKRIGSSEKNIDVSDFVSGMYFIVISEQDKIYKQKILITK